MMKLYHGTSALAWRKIGKAQELRPRGRRPSVWATASNPAAVYLTNAYALHFCMNSVGHSDKEKSYAIIEVDTDHLHPLKFAPDEDFLEQVSRRDPSFEKRLSGKTMEGRTLYFRKRMHSEYRSFWALSLEKLGNCAYFGTIPIAAVSRVALVPCGHEICRASDPTITLLNYHLLGGFYRNLMRVIFGDLDKLESDPFQRSAPLVEIDRTGIEVVTF